MRRRPQTRTSKGKKLKGLTKAEASARAKKGWITKHRKYQYATELARKNRKKAIWDEEDFELEDDLSPEELIARHRAEQASGRGGKGDRDAGLAAFRQKQLEEARHYARENEFKDPEFRNELSRASPDEIRAFQAQVRQQKEARRKATIEGIKLTDPDTGLPLQPEMLLANDKQRDLREGFHGLINKDPKLQGVRWSGQRDDLGQPKLWGARTESPGETRRRVRRELENLTIVSDPFGHEPFKGQRHRSEAGSRHTTPHTKKVQLKGGKPKDIPKTTPNTIGLLKRSERQRLEDLIVRSHHGSSQAERFAAQREAVKLAGKLSQKGASNYELREDIGEIVKFQRTLEGDPSERKWAEVKAAQDAIKENAQGHKTRPIGKDIQPTPIDPRISPTIANEYASSGHTDAHFARLKWEANRLRRQEQGEKPPAFQEIRQQAKFHREQQRRRKEGWISGNASMGIDENGKMVPLTAKNAKKVAFAVAPNAVYEYELRDDAIDSQTGRRRPNYKYKVEAYDQDTRFEIGRRHRDTLRLRKDGRMEGELLPGQSDEIVNVRRRTKYKRPIVFEVGKRVDPKIEDIPLPQGVDSRAYIPVRGAIGAKRTIKDPDKNKQLYEVRDSGGKWHPVTRSEWASTKKDYRRKYLAPKHVETHYVDPSRLKLKNGNVDTVSFQLPSANIRGRELGERRVIVNLAEGTKRDVILGGPIRARRQRNAERQYQEAAHVLDLYNQRVDPLQIMDAGPRLGGKTHGEITALAGATFAAGRYAAKNNAEQRLRHGLNRTYALARKNTRINDLAEKYNADEVILDVDEAFLRPLGVKMNDAGFRVRHPSHDPSGKAFGLDWGRIRDREHWIQPEKREIRKLQKSRAEIERVARGKQTVRNATEKGGRFRNWKAEPMMRYEGYKNWDEFVGLRLEEADKILGSEVLHRPDSKTGRIKEIPVTPRMKFEAAYFKDHVKGLKRAEDYLDRNVTPHTPSPRRASRYRHANFTPNEKTALIAGGVVATAVGSHYLYHRYQNSKLPEEERQTYLNRITPGKITAKTPYVRSTAHYRIADRGLAHEFGVGNRRIPLAFGVGMQDKTLWKGKPSDRGYDANTALGITKVRSGKAGPGSLRKSVAFDMDRPRGRTLRRGTHQIEVAGKRVPVKIEMGKRQKIELSRTNPNRLSKSDRENIVWAYKGHPDEQAVKNFYSFGKRDRIVDMFDDEAEIARVSRRKGAPEEQKFYKSFYSSVQKNPLAAAGGRTGGKINLKDNPRRGDREKIADTRRQEAVRKNRERDRSGKF